MRNVFILLFCTILAGAMVFLMPAQAQLPIQSSVTTERVNATLMTERIAVSPGDSIWIGLRLEMAKGWHTYWRNPGDSGLPTTIDWVLPDGVTAGPIQWPAPERQPYGTLMNFGYSNNVTLLTRLSFAPGTPTKSALIAARATWLVCADICIPEDGSFAISINVDQSTPLLSTLDGAHLRSVAATLPEFLQSPIEATITKDALVITAEWDDVPPGEIVFYPYPTYLMDNSDSQQVIRTNSGFRIEVATVPDPELKSTMGGLIVIGTGDSQRAFSFENAPITVAGSNPLSIPMVASAANIGLMAALLFAFAGGLILNLMPCVLPVLSIKALAVMKHASDADANKRQALAYTAGVMASFGLLVLILLALKAGGESLGWGFQLQSPSFVTVLAYVMFAVGLSLSGVFDIGTSLMGVGSGLINKDGPWESFLTGVLAAVVATPCTAPFMAPAIGYALTQPPLIILIIFESLALGLAAPFLLIGFVSSVARALPKPGPWMNTFKQVLAFPMYGSAAWLIWVVAQQVDPVGFAATLAGFILIAFGIWLLGFMPREGRGRLLAGGSATAVLLSAIAIAVLTEAQPPGKTPASTVGTNWESFSLERVQELNAAGVPVFVNFTALGVLLVWLMNG